MVGTTMDKPMNQCIHQICGGMMIMPRNARRQQECRVHRTMARGLFMASGARRRPRVCAVRPSAKQALEPNYTMHAHAIRSVQQNLCEKHAIHARKDASFLDTPRGEVPSGLHQLCRTCHPAQQQKRSRQHTAIACLSCGWGHTPRKSQASKGQRQRGQWARAWSHMDS